MCPNMAIFLAWNYHEKCDCRNTEKSKKLIWRDREISQIPRPQPPGSLVAYTTYCKIAWRHQAIIRANVVSSSVLRQTTLRCRSKSFNQRAIPPRDEWGNSLRRSDAYMRRQPRTSWLATEQATCHYWNQCGNKLQGNFNRYSYILIQENVFENVIRKMAAILSQPQCVKLSTTATSLKKIVYYNSHMTPPNASAGSPQCQDSLLIT